MNNSKRDAFLEGYKRICINYSICIDVSNGEPRLFSTSSRVQLDAHLENLRAHFEAILDLEETSP